MNRLLPRPAAGLIGVAGLLLYGWGLYHLLLIGSCSTPPSDGLPACPPGSERFFLAVFAGLFIVIPSVIAGAGLLVFMGIFATTGGTALLASMQPGSPLPAAFTVPFAGGFLAAPVLMVVGLVAGGVRKARAERLVQTGVEAIGTVLAVQDTGVTINNNPRVRMRFRIEPVAGFPPPYEAEKTATVPRVSIPRVGDRYPVWIDPENPDEWAYGSGEPDATASPAMRRLFDLARAGARPRLPAPATQLSPDALARLDELNRQRAEGRLTDQEFAMRAVAELGYLPS